MRINFDKTTFKAEFPPKNFDSRTFFLFQGVVITSAKRKNFLICGFFFNGPFR